MDKAKLQQYTTEKIDINREEMKNIMGGASIKRKKKLSTVIIGIRMDKTDLPAL